MGRPAHGCDVYLGESEPVHVDGNALMKFVCIAAMSTTMFQSIVQCLIVLNVLPLCTQHRWWPIIHRRRKVNCIRFRSKLFILRRVCAARCGAVRRAHCKIHKSIKQFPFDFICRNMVDFRLADRYFYRSSFIVRMILISSLHIQSRYRRSPCTVTYS